MTATEWAGRIEEISERMCIDHIGYRPGTWYTGGSNHNDDRLVAKISENGDVEVWDGTDRENVSPPFPDPEKYVRDWLSMLWDT